MNNSMPYSKNLSMGDHVYSPNKGNKYKKFDIKSYAMKNQLMLAHQMAQKGASIFISDLTKKLINSLKENEARYRLEFFHQEPTIYSHRVFLRASKLYTVLKQSPVDSPYQRRKKVTASTGIAPPVADEEFENDDEKRLTYELAFKALKYQTVLTQITQEVSFFSYNPELREEESLVMVMLCDFQNRKFQHRSPLESEDLDELCLQVEQAILASKTKLDACLARHRIKAAAPHIEFLLPENIRKQEDKYIKMPVYMWVNQLKTTVEEVIEQLKQESFLQVTGQGAELNGKQFMMDHHCNDLLVFSPECSSLLRTHKLLKTGKIVMQDKSSCLAPHSAKHLLNDDDDIIHVNIGSGLTTAHLASLLAKTQSTIWAFGSNNPAENYRIYQNLEHLGAKKVKVVNQFFLDVDPEDNRFKAVRAVLVVAACSKSAVTNPVEFVINEGEDMKILQDLSSGDTDKSRIGELIGNHSAVLRHALKISKSQAVVYLTRSVYSAENENVVSKAMEYINMVQQRRIPFRLVPPVLPFNAEEIEKKVGISGKYMKFAPSSKMNGCFVAVITREPQDAKEAAREIIARAHSKGLLVSKGSPKKIIRKPPTNAIPYPSSLLPVKPAPHVSAIHTHISSFPRVPVIKPTQTTPLVLPEQIPVLKRTPFIGVRHSAPFK